MGRHNTLGEGELQLECAPPQLRETRRPKCRTSCMTSAAAGSTEDVASSSSNSRGARSSTRASASSCCWPWDSAAAPSPSRNDSTAASSARCAAAARSPLSRSGLAAAPPAVVPTARAALPRGAPAAEAPATAPATPAAAARLGSCASRGRHRCTLCSAAARSAVLCWHRGSRFSRTVPSNRKGCCGTTPAQPRGSTGDGVSPLLDQLAWGPGTRLPARRISMARQPVRMQSLRQHTQPSTLGGTRLSRGAAPGVAARPHRCHQW